eukprot:GHVP01053035.1.p1 GENE.GHVP01053035.1~~GHVP01053035.1.p1  ORF type:complete len:581 (+),score=128.09 GHVP01053035.1:1168-2910(+)
MSSNDKRKDAERRLSRLSLSGPTRATKQPAERRLSAAPEQNKRTSISRNTISRLSISRAVAKKDPRPLKEKSFQATIIGEIHDFLVNNGYDGNLMIKTLSAPTSKDFQTIFRFIYRFIDPLYEGDKKFEEDVLTLLKGLKYPFVGEITKSCLYAVGSPHAWPTLLGMLHWLVELVCIASIEDERDMKKETNEQVFSTYISKSYREFLAGENDYRNAEENLRAIFNEKNRQSTEEVEELEKKASAIKAEIKKETDKGSDLIQIRERKELLASDIDKIGKYIDQIQRKIEKFAESVDRGFKEHSVEEEKKKTLEVQRNELDVKIKAQKISPEDIDRMNAEKETLEEKSKSLFSTRESMKFSLKEKEAKNSYLTRTIDELINEYHSAVKKADLSVETSGESTFGIIFNKDLREGKALNRDIREEIAPQISVLREKLTNEISCLVKRKFEFAEQLEKLSEVLSDKDEIIKEMETRIEKLIIFYQTEKTEFTSESTQSAEKIEELDMTIQKIRTETTTGLLDRKQHLQKLSISADTLEAEVASNRDHMVRKAFEFVSEMVAFKNEIETVLGEMEAAFIDEFEKYN